MKWRTIIERFVYLIITGIILLVFPGFFRSNPEFRFIWGMFTAIGISTQFYALIKSRKHRKRRMASSAILLLSSLMAYDMGNWDVLIRSFPALSPIPQHILVLRAILFFVCLGISAGVYTAAVNRWKASKTADGKLRKKSVRPLHPQKSQAPAKAPASAPFRSGAADYEDHTLDTDCNEQAAGRLTIVKFIGYLATFIFLVIAFAAAAYILLKNGDAPDQFVTVFAWSSLLLCMFSLMFVGVSYVIRLIKAVITDICLNKRFTIESPPFLRLLSITVILVLEVIFYQTDLDGWFTLLKRPDEIAPLLKGLLMLFLLFLLSEAAYRMLCSFITPGGIIRRCANRFCDQFFVAGTALLSNLLTPLGSVPERLKKSLLRLFPLLVKWVNDYFFDADVEKTGLDKKIWYPFAYGSLLFSVVSFVGTARGMMDNVFDGNALLAYFVSFGVQAFLLTFNLHLPKMLLHSTAARKRAAIFFYTITVAFSCFFSFTFISNTIYAHTWQQDAHLELSDAFLTARNDLDVLTAGLFNDSSARLSSDIMEIQENLSVQADSVTAPDWEEVKKNAASDTELLSIADTLAATDAISTSRYTQYSGALDSKQKALLSASELLGQDISNLESKISDLDTEIQELIDKRYLVKRHSAAHESFTDRINALTTDQDEYKQQLKAKREALRENESKEGAIESVSFYLSALNSQSGGLISAKFSDILTALSTSTPDAAAISDASDAIFCELTQNSASQGNAGSAQYTGALDKIQSLKGSIAALTKASKAQAWISDTDDLIFEMDSLVSASATDDDIRIWRSRWNAAMSDVKNHLKAIEPYLDQDKASSITALSDTLSTLKRNYLLDLNNIETAKNHLLGQHPTLARLSILLAVYLDAAPIFVSALFASAESAPSCQRKRVTRAILAGANLFLLFFILWPAG